jgi:hypothetical protein
MPALGPEGGILSVMWKNLARSYVVACVIMAASGPEALNGQDTAQSMASPGTIAGDWALNRALSDDPNEQLQNVRAAARPPGSRPPESAGRPEDGSTLNAVRRAVEAFGIGQTDSTVTIAYPDRELLLFTDGRKQKTVLDDGRELEYRAWRDGGSVVIERKLDGGVVLTENYSLHAGTGRLHVLTRLEGDRLPQRISFMLVYDPLEPKPGG